MGMSRAMPEMIDSSRAESTGQLAWRDLAICLLLAGLCAAMYLPRLGERGPWTAGEARAVLTPRVMLDRGEWVAMRMPPLEIQVNNERGFPVIDDLFRGRALSEKIAPLATTGPDGSVGAHNFDFEQRITIHKPVGYYWLIAALGRAGVPISVTTARLTSSLSAMLTVLLVYLMGSRLFSRRAGLIAAVALATSVHFIWIARVAKMDMVITLLMTAVLGLFWAACRTRRHLSASLLMYVLLAAAVLIKGPGYVGIPALLMGVYLLCEYVLFRPNVGFFAHFWGLIRRLHVGWGVLVVLALTVPWYWAIHAKTGGQWTEVMFLRHHLARFGIYEYGKEFEEKTSPLIYLYLMWPLLFPWIIFLPGALVEVVRKRSRPMLRSSLFVTVWFLFLLAFFSLMKFRKDEYLMPAYPAIMLLVGFMLDQYLPSRRREGAAVNAGGAAPARDVHLNRAIGGAYVFLAICAAGVIAFAVALRWPATLRLAQRLDDNRNTHVAMTVLHESVREHGWAVMSFSAALVLLLALALWSQFRGRTRLALAVLAISAGGLTTATIHLIMAQIDSYRTQKAFVEQAVREIPPGQPIVLLGLESHELVYWLDERSRGARGRGDVWPLYDLLLIAPRRADGSGPDAGVARFNVLLAQCRYWAEHGQTPYVITQQRSVAGLTRGGMASWFEPVIEPPQLGQTYVRHRMPLALLRYRLRDAATDR